MILFYVSYLRNKKLTREFLNPWFANQNWIMGAFWQVVKRPQICGWAVTHRQQHSYKTFSSAYFQDHCNPLGCKSLINMGRWVSYLSFWNESEQRFMSQFSLFTVCFHLFCLNFQVISWLDVTSVNITDQKVHVSHTTHIQFEKIRSDYMYLLCFHHLDVKCSLYKNCSPMLFSLLLESK